MLATAAALLLSPVIHAALPTNAVDVRVELAPTSELAVAVFRLVMPAMEAPRALVVDRKSVV